MTRLALLLAALLATLPAFAVEPNEILKDPALEHRARDVGQALRCVVCQNQSIDDSNAELARDMRILVRERILKGDSDRQVLDYMVSRYGDFVLLDPPFKATTYALWFGAPLIVLLGLGGVLLFYRRRNADGAEIPDEPAPLSAEEKRRLEALFKEDGR
ncbi:MAG: cytochrome c-type biogenesis protein CcmH [Magnetospirillum sp. WYHS-4]